MNVIIALLAGGFVMTVGILIGFFGGLWVLTKAFANALCDDPEKIVIGIKSVVQDLYLHGLED